MSNIRPRSRRPRVCFLTLVLTHYRVRFHELVREQLSRKGIEYDLVYSDPIGDGAHKGDTVELAWGHKVPVRSLRLFGQELYWQEALNFAAAADLTIVSQENKLLVNYVLQTRYWLTGRPRLAFFGHGKGHGAGAFGRSREAWKRFLATRVHWWFAYTPGVVDLLRSYGFPGERITVNNNTIDVDELAADLSSISLDDVAAFRRDHQLGEGPVCAFLGSIYPKKRISFLIEAAREIRRHIPNFELVIAGAGSALEKAKRAAAQDDFIKFLPPSFGRGKATLLRVSSALLVPGAVGLIAIDSFAAARPIVTCAAHDHGPEIDYLDDGTNAIVLPREASPKEYAAQVIRLLSDKELARHLSDGALQAARRYSIENMASNVVDGVQRALS